MTQSLPKAFRPLLSPRVSLPLLFFTVTLLAFGTAAPRMLTDMDVAWHIAVGDLIRQLGYVPTHTPWSFTSGDTTWLNGAWLWDVLISRLHEWGGLALVLHFHLLLDACTIALLAAACMNRGAGVVATALVCCAVLLLIKPFVSVRSHNITYFLLVLFQWLLHRWYGGKTELSPWWLVAIMAWWPSFHGLFLAGFVLLGAYGAAALFSRQWSKLRQLVWIGLACTVVIFTTPLGVGLLRHAFRAHQSMFLTYLEEWQPFHLVAPYAQILPYMLLCLWLARPRSFKELTQGSKLADLLVLALWALMGLQQVRHLSIFLLISAPVFAAALEQALAAAPNRLAIMLHRRDRDYHQLLASAKTGVTALALALAGIFSLASGVATRSLFPQGSATFPSHNAPQAAIDFILQHEKQPRFLTHYNFGGYLIYATRGKIPVFIDGRAEGAYAPAVARDYLTFDLLRPGWQDVLVRYQLNGALLPPSPEYDKAFASIGWRKAFSSPTADVFLRP